MPKQTIVTAVFVRSPQNLSVSVFLSKVIQKDLKLECFTVTSQNVTVTIVCFWQI